MSKAIHCDRDGCDTWERTKPANPYLGQINPHADAWIVVHAADHRERHFCTLDCLTHWAAANSGR